MVMQPESAPADWTKPEILDATLEVRANSTSLMGHYIVVATSGNGTLLWAKVAD